MKEKITILTSFKEFNPGNSLTGIVLDQIEMLRRHGHQVSVVVNEGYHGEDIPNVKLQKVLPFFHLRDYGSQSQLLFDHKQYVDNTSHALVEVLSETDIAISHDLMFQGWYMPYALGVRQATDKLPNVRWLHWVHSIPARNKDWWDIRALRPNHKIVFPNQALLLHVASQFKGLLSDTRCVHHIKDMRSWFDFEEDTKEFIETYPAVMQADVVKIYPASSDRLTAKRVSEVMQIFGNIKNQGYSVCLVIANQWATTLTRKEDLRRFNWEAECRGLKPGKDFIFTSDFKPPKYETGLPKKMVRELFALSNLFIFPTREESFGLVSPEASLTGGVLLVLNRSLQVLHEVVGGNALFYDFGSFNNPFVNLEGDAYYNRIAREIMARMLTNEAIRARSYIRQELNWDSLYLKEYKPLFEESKSWVE